MKLTSDEVLRQNRPPVLGDVRPAIDTQGPRLVVWNAVGFKCCVSTHILAVLLHIFNEQILDHALMNEENVGV